MARPAGMIFRIRRVLASGLCLAVLALGAITRADAAPASAASSELPHNELAAFELLRQSEHAADFAETESLLQRALALVPDPSPLRGMIVCTLGGQLFHKSYEDRTYQPKAIAMAEECNRLMPNLPAAQLLSGMAKLTSGQARAGGALVLASMQAEPRLLGPIDIATMDGIFRQLRYARATDLLDEMRLFLVKVGYGKDNPRFFGDMAIDAMAASIARQSSSEALALLPQIMDPEPGLRLLIDRRFEPIWPMVEQWAGGDLKQQRDANVAAARAQFKVDPSLPNRRILADTLWGSGLRAEAVQLLKQAVDDPKLWDEDRYFISLIASRYGAMLLFQEKADEAIAAVTRVNDAITRDKAYGASNLMPNLAKLLIEANRSQEALDLIARQMPAAGSLEDTASFGFYAALRFCAYSRLNKSREAVAYFSMLSTRYAANVAAMRLASSCAMTEKTAPAFWSTRLRDPNDRDALITLLRARAGIRTIGMLDEFGTERFVRDNAQLRAAFEGIARDLPPSYLPALSMWAEDTAPTMVAK